MKDSLTISVDRFVLAARSFVRWCESPHANDEPDRFRQETLSRLAELYAAAHNLPDDVFEDAPDVPAEPVGRLDELMTNFTQMPFQLYWQALEPSNLDKDGNVACGDILDDLSDIYCDIGDGLWLYDHGYPKAAVWHWQLLYTHWGNHVIGAMHALHLYERPEITGELANGN